MGLKKIWNWLRAKSKNPNPTGNTGSKSTSWVPKLGEFYYYYDFDMWRMRSIMCDPNPGIFNERVTTGNCFKTAEEITEKALFKVLKKKKKFYKKNGFRLEN